MMKKYIYILFVLALSLSCVKEQGIPDEIMFEGPDEDGPMVTLTFSLPPETKGNMAHDPDITTIHVAVFNKAGVLKQFEQATLRNTGNLTNGDNASGNPEYSVDIHMSAKPRILHFIADSPITTYDALVAAAGTSGEDVILNALTTTGGTTAYWQRFELDRVDAYKYQGGVYEVPGGGTVGSVGGTSYTYTYQGQTITVNEGDYIKTNGEKVLDGTGYFQSDYVSGVISNIPFIRNFAEITVSAPSGSNFIPKKFALVNVPTKGYVAPYDADAGAFAAAYTASVSGPAFDGTLSYSSVHDTGYPGTLAGALDTSEPSSFIDLTTSSNCAYMYERPLPNTSQPSTCILVGGAYSETGANKDTDGLTWLMIELDNDGVYFPIYRGISYTVSIGSVEGTKGYSSPSDAYNAEPIGDISSSVTTATLTQINDGKGTTLWVEYIDYVATWAQTKTIYYTMFYNDGSTVTYLNNTVSATFSHPNASYPAIVSINTSDDATYTTGTPDDTKEWKKVSVLLDGSGMSTKRSVLRISGTAHDGKTMYRDVNYRVIGIQHFEYGTNVLSGTPLEDEDAGETTTLTIWLPTDLGFSMFPLTLRIEAENAGFTTADSPGLPVEYGPSLFDNTKTSFYFLKTISYEDYYNAATGVTTNSFTATFKTTRAGSTMAGGTNATTFAVLDKVNANRINPYFETATCYVPVGSHVFNLSASTATVDASITSAKFNVVSSSVGTWTLAASEGASVSPSSGKGNKEVTVTFPVNTDTVNDKTYTVTASLDGFASQTFTVTQLKSDVTGDVDILTNAWTGISGNEYTTAAGLVGTASGSLYTVRAAGSNSTIQLRTTGSESGIVNTTSVGHVKKITVRWNSATNSTRTLQIYAKNTPYSAPSDLFDASKQGTLVTTFLCSDGNGSYTFSSDYRYIGIRSADQPLYLDEVDIEWTPCAWTLDGIAITTSPTVTSYTEGEYFDPSGMVVTATYHETANASNTFSEALTAYTYSPDGALTTSDGIITVSHTEGGVTKTATQAITVSSAGTIVAGTPWSYTFTAKVWTANGTQTINDRSWTLAGTGGGYMGYNSDKGQQFGSAGNPYSAMTLTSNFGSTYGVSQISISTSGASDISATVSISVGGVAFTCSSSSTASLTSTNTEYTFVSPDGNLKAGDIVISYANSSAKAIYIKSINVNPSGGGGGGSNSETVTFSSQSYSDGSEVSSYTGTNFSVTFDKGTNSISPKYYTSGSAIRVYGGGYFTVTSSHTITQIDITFGSDDGSNEITTDVVSYSSGTWTGSSSSVKFTVGGTTGHRRIASIAVTYTN